MRQSSSPLYKQIAAKIKADIHSGVFKQGDAIPPEMKLAEEYNASRVTIRQAIENLVSEGLLYKIRGSGTYVKENKIEHNIYSLQGFTEEMLRLNKKPENKILEFHMIDPDENTRKKLLLDKGDKVFFITRLRLVDGQPVVLEKTYLPVALFPDLSYEVMRHSKYDYIENQKNYRIKESFQEMIPILPEADIKELLNLEETIPILMVKLWSTLEDGSVFEYTELFFKSDEYRFTITASRHS